MNENTQMNLFLQHQHQVLEMIADNSPLSFILEKMVLLVEEQLTDSMVSILILDKTNTYLTDGVGPSLPESYMDKLDGIKIGPNSGSCGTAVYFGETVIVSDISTNPLWLEYRDITLNHGLKACWSKPILSPKGIVLGSFSFYHKECRSPSSDDLAMLEGYSRLAGIAIDYKQAVEKRSSMDSYDYLTGLPNDVQFNKILNETIVKAKKDQQTFSVMFIDLGRFSVINSYGGYEVGDQVLKKVSKLFTDNFGERCTIARWKSDKFLCILHDSAEELANQQAQRLIHLLSKPILIEGQEFVVTPSIGISFFPQDGEQANLLIKNAEVALSYVKSTEKNTYSFYTHTMNNCLSNQICIEQDLRKAIQLNQFHLCYQPQISLHTNQVVGVEALIRWEHPTIGMISPGQFIPLAEETGLIVPIGEWVIRTACLQMLEWKKAGLPEIMLSLNLSGVQLYQSNIVQKISEILIELNFSPAQLMLEVTESSLVKNMEITSEKLNRLKELGIHISLDDFGTLYSSLNYLKNLPLDVLKIDRSFVRDITNDEKDLEIVKAIIQLGHSLRLKVLAEGVEKKEQASFLREHNCDEVQGFYFAKPLSVQDIEQFIKNNFYCNPFEDFV
jgi:diguanylate cyclase (GGDEF)-like protein